MRKITCLLILALFIVASCQKKVTNKPVDLAAIKENVGKWMEKYTNSINQKNVVEMASMLSEGSLSLGTDPDEYFDKKTLVDMWTKVAADSTVKYNFTPARREIRVAPDGNSAIVIDQYIIESISKKIMTRVDYLLVRNGEGWLIDYSNFAVIPKNEVLVSINKFLEEGK